MSEKENYTIQVGQKLRMVRQRRGLSQRELAKLSGLSPNTLGLLERGQTSPTVSTLQKLAVALDVDINAFFGSSELEANIIYIKANQRLHLPLLDGLLADLKAGFPHSQMKPFYLKLNPGAQGGPPVSHKGEEFIYCLRGQLLYLIDDSAFLLEPGDSLFFDAERPHRWQNSGTEVNEALLILCQHDVDTDSISQHFNPEEVIPLDEI